MKKFKVNDIVVITIETPDGLSEDCHTLNNVGIIFNKDGEDYEVFVKCGDKYGPVYFGPEQMRHATQEEIVKEFANLIDTYRLEKTREHEEAEKKAGHALIW